MGKNNSELLFPADHALKLYEQVIHYVTVRIDRGDWQADTKLPSVRSLAQELGVHRLTVFRAYQELKQRGLVYVKDKSGYYVHASPATGTMRNMLATRGIHPLTLRFTPNPPMRQMIRLFQPGGEWMDLAAFNR